MNKLLIKTLADPISINRLCVQEINNFSKTVKQLDPSPFFFLIKKQTKTLI